MPSYEYVDGRMVEIPDIEITESGTLERDVRSTLIVRSGVQLTTSGDISGTVQVQRGASLSAIGHVSGTVHVASGAQAEFHSRMDGTLHVDSGGVATLLPGSVALGSMSIDGLLINEGTRGVQVHGRGSVEDRDGSRVREPDEIRQDGAVVYRN